LSIEPSPAIAPLARFGVRASVRRHGLS